MASGRARISLDEQRIADFCRKWEVRSLSLFGSVLRDDFGTDSDVDVLVSFSDEARPTLFDLVEMERELGEILGRRADLVERNGLEHSPNYIIRRRILDDLEPIYVAG